MLNKILKWYPPQNSNLIYTLQKSVNNTVAVVGSDGCCVCNVPENPVTTTFMQNDCCYSLICDINCDSEYYVCKEALDVSISQD